ncbi:MAG: YceH family protein [Proteobacteria bacterium]|nr:YceH family protein [Pseudomonadota bacterium]
MEYSLDEIEARILGVLIEKQMTTPDYYPLTLNALLNGCNQKSNRNPVMNCDENEVESALQRLREKHLVWQVKTHGSRTVKFEHNMKEAVDFSADELGIICVLLLRGSQTIGELKSRTTRMVEFHGLAAVEHILQKLMSHEKGPFVEKQARMPGQKESRYAQLFCMSEQEELGSDNTGKKEDADNDRVDQLAEKVDVLEAELQDLRMQFSEFKRQFE